MIIVCPNPDCRSDLWIEKDWMGKVIRCKTCQKTITLKTYPKPAKKVKTTSKDNPEILRRKIIAFFKAVLSGDAKSVAILLKFSPKLAHIHDAKGRQALHLATSKNKVDTIEILLAAGADINARDSKGNTSLHISVMEGNYECFEHLIAKGAKINIENNQNLTPIDLARTSTNPKFKSQLN